MLRGKYLKEKCTMKTGSGVVSLTCSYVEFPSHPHHHRRVKCGAELMKKVKTALKYKLVPKKLYVYNSILSSLQELVLRPHFRSQCEHWRNRSESISDGWLTDVYDGKLWREWFRKEGNAFLAVPGNLLLMMNVDWFKPFERSAYSIGVIYLVVQNLPRSLRFKLENVIVVVAGPREPKNTINSYLKPLINDLLKLWEGVQMRTSGSILARTFVRAALGYITSDIPATRKICGFYGIRAKKGCSKCLSHLFHSVIMMYLDQI